MSVLLMARERTGAPQAPATDEITAALDTACVYVGSGWCKGQAVMYVEGHEWPCYCLVGAITRASRTTQIRDAALHATRLALGRVMYSLTLEEFNDVEKVVVGDVIALLRSAKGYVGRVAA